MEQLNFGTRYAQSNQNATKMSEDWAAMIIDAKSTTSLAEHCDRSISYLSCPASNYYHHAQGISNRKEVSGKYINTHNSNNQKWN